VLWPDQGPPEPTGAARPEAQRSPASWPAVDSQDGSGLRGVGRALLFHHDPARTDDEVDAILESFADAPITVLAAAEGEVHEL